MSLACESDVCVQNQLALRLSLVSKPAPILDYVKTISSLIGASHILAVFEETDSIKIFFDEKRYMDIVIRRGIHVMGCHVTVDYVVPPGTRIVLSNIDPVISNCDLLRLLSIYGTVVSPVIRPPLSEDTEFCHIDYGVRYVYMVLHGNLGSSIDFKYGDQLCKITVRIGNSVLTPYIKTDSETSDVEYDANRMMYPALPGPSHVEYYDIENSDPVVVSVQSAVSETTEDEKFHIPKSPTKKKVPAKRSCRVPKSLCINHSGLTPASRAAKRIKQNANHKWAQGKKHMKHFRKGKPRRKPGRPGKKPPVLSPSTSSTSSNHLAVLENDFKLPTLDNNGVMNKSSNILNEFQFKMFLDEVKFHRAPVELAKKYLGDDCSNEMMLRLTQQLSEYKENNVSQNLRLRLHRLIKLLQNSLT